MKRYIPYFEATEPAYLLVGGDQVHSPPRLRRSAQPDDFDELVKIHGLQVAGVRAKVGGLLLIGWVIGTAEAGGR
jgi:hypothetical protein